MFIMLERERHRWRVKADTLTVPEHSAGSGVYAEVREAIIRLIDAEEIRPFTVRFGAAFTEVITAKAEHRAPATPEGVEAEPAPVVDLMAALEASVARAKEARGESSGPATVHEMPKKKAAAKKTTTAKKTPAKKTAAKKTTRRRAS
ncbi:hypothetical protein [Streptomyces sp. NPDC055055]